LDLVLLTSECLQAVTLSVAAERCAVDVVTDGITTETGGESCKSPGGLDAGRGGGERQSDET